jgi:large subunit ribosomal protein L23
MALFNFLKKAKKGGALQAPEQGLRQTPKRVASERGEPASPAKRGEERERPKAAVALHKSPTAWRLLREPHVTEKATRLTHLNQYVFRVFPKATKPEVKKAIEGVYGVHVVKVRKVVLPRKKRKKGRHIGWRPGHTKAIVTLREGEKIEVLPH